MEKHIETIEAELVDQYVEVVSDEELLAAFGGEAIDLGGILGRVAG